MNFSFNLIQRINHPSKPAHNDVLTGHMRPWIRPLRETGYFGLRMIRISQILQSLHCFCVSSTSVTPGSPQAMTPPSAPQCIVVVVDDHTRVSSFLQQLYTSDSLALTTGKLEDSV